MVKPSLFNPKRLESVSPEKASEVVLLQTAQAARDEGTGMRSATNPIRAAFPRPKLEWDVFREVAELEME